jgi:hypothetical protein
MDGLVHLFKRLGVVPRAFDLAIATAAVAHADLLDQPLREDRPGGHVADLVLQ